MLKTKTKKSVQKLTLHQIVKIVESIDLKQLPMDEKNHELLKKLFNIIMKFLNILLLK